MKRRRASDDTGKEGNKYTRGGTRMQKKDKYEGTKEVTVKTKTLLHLIKSSKSKKKTGEKVQKKKRVRTKR